MRKFISGQGKPRAWKKSFAHLDLLTKENSCAALCGAQAHSILDVFALQMFSSTSQRSAEELVEYSKLWGGEPKGQGIHSL